MADSDPPWRRDTFNTGRSSGGRRGPVSAFFRRVVGLLGSPRLRLGVGVTALCLSVAVAFGAPMGPFAVLATPATAVLAGVLAGGIGLRAAYRAMTGRTDGTGGENGSSVPVPVPTLPRGPDSEGDVDDTVGGTLDGLVATVAGDAEAENGDTLVLTRKRRTVRSTVRRAAVDVLVDTEGLTFETASELVETGEWTTDPRAAAFLGSEAPPPPVAMRLRDWAAGERFRRQVEAAVDEIAALAGVETELDAANGESVSFDTARRSDQAVPEWGLPDAEPVTAEDLAGDGDTTEVPTIGDDRDDGEGGDRR